MDTQSADSNNDNRSENVFSKLTDKNATKTDENLISLDDSIKHFNSLKDEFIIQSWLKCMTEDLNKKYRELRQNIRNNKNIWSSSQYNYHLALYYYNLALFYYREHFLKHKVDLDSAQRSFKKCLKILEEIPEEECNDKTVEIKNKAKSHLNKLNKKEEQILNDLKNNEEEIYIILGKIHFFLKTCFNTNNSDSKKNMQNIFLLKMINMLEDAITVPEKKNVTRKSEYSNYLAQAYELAGQIKISKRYVNTSASILSNQEQYNISEENETGKCGMRIIIREELKIHKSTLPQIKEYIAEKFKTSLNSEDESYIERKFFKYCTFFWLQEISEFLKQQNDNKNFALIREIFTQFKNINELKEINLILNQFEYFELILGSINLISKEEETNIMKDFKSKCLEQMTALNESIGKEIKFLECLVDVIDGYRDLETVTTKLKFKNFYNDELTFQEFLQNIREIKINNLNLTPLKDATKNFQGQENLFFVDNLKRIMNGYIKPIELKERKMDNRLLLEIHGKSIVLSNILSTIENKLRTNSKIEEIRFIDVHIILVNQNLGNKVWHGKNIVIITKFMKIIGKITWNVSGENNNFIYKNDAGTSSNGDGNPGLNGYPGESGGNVLILAEEIENFEAFTIISNGGNGSTGQNGGKGIDGRNGNSITKQEMLNSFNPICLGLDSPFTTPEKIFSRINDKIIKHSHKYVEKVVGRMIQGFIEGETPERNIITLFFLTKHRPLQKSQVFFLYYGSPGQLGGSGGEFGLGGQCGFSGEISVVNIRNNENFNVKTINKIGKNGKNGQEGNYGIHGKDGLDIAYIRTYRTKRPICYISKDNEKLFIEYSDEASKHSIYNPIFKKYGTIRRTSNPSPPHLKKYNQNKRIVQNMYSKNNIKATKKKNISKQQLLSNYLNKLSSEKIELNNLKSELKEMKEKTLEIATENEEEKRNENININRQIKFEQKRKIKLKKPKIAKTKQNKQIIHSKINEQKYNIHITFEKVLSNFDDTNKTIKLKQLTNIHMYKYAALRKIAPQLQNIENNNNYLEEMKLKNIEKYLFETKDHYNAIANRKLGRLVKYLCENTKEDRVKIKNYCREILKSKTDPFLQHLVGTFVLENGNLENANGSIKKYYKEYISYLEMLKSGHVVFLESFNKLDGLCSEDESILEEYFKHLLEKNLNSRSYREILSHIYGVNIKYFSVVEDKLILQDDHNPLSQEIVYICQKYNKFIEMNINENFLKLTAERKFKDEQYEQILSDINSLISNQKFVDYYRNKKFLCNNKTKTTKTLSCDEELFIINIIKNYTDQEQIELKERLENIATKYTNQRRVLENISNRFSLEGPLISSQILKFFINFVLRFTVNNNEIQNTISWIVASYAQENWIDELLLMQIQDYYKNLLIDQIAKWRTYLSKITNKYILIIFSAKLDEYKSNIVIPSESINVTLYLLSNMPNEDIDLERINLSEWPYILKEIYWKHELKILIKWEESEKISTASHYLLSIENIHGFEIVQKFLTAVGKEKEKICSAKLLKILFYFYSEIWHLNEEEVRNIETFGYSNWINAVQNKISNIDKVIDIEQLISLITNNAHTSKEILENLSMIKKSIININQQYKNNRKQKNVSNLMENDIQNWAKWFQNNRNNKFERDNAKLLAIVDRAIKLKRGFHLRDTQKLVILILLNNKTNILAQVGTGEGKSLIVVSVAIIKALYGEKVDIVTSSLVLATRDAENNKDIFNLFNINVSHNCNEEIEKRKMAYSCNDVVYGELSNFQRDYLLDQFYEKNIFGDRSFENIIVDEVDSMLLDKGNNVLYLSHNMPGFDKLESVYFHIWQKITQPINNYNDFASMFDPASIKASVLDNLYNYIKIDDLEKLDSKLDKYQISLIWERMLEEKILDEDGKLLDFNVSTEKLNKILPDENSIYTNRLRYILKLCSEKEKYIRVPNYLKPFIELHLDSWINNAITAYFMKEKQHYVLDVNRRGNLRDRNPNIIILDVDTGTDQINCQWDEGLHQFLQLKHGCKISTQTLKAVFISNVSFFKKYEKLYGLTGTLGSQRERDLLKEIYQTHFVTIPPSKSKKFNPEKPLLCEDKTDWINCILNETNKKIREKKQSVLIICETVTEVRTLYVAFGGKKARNVFAYYRDHQNLDIVQGNKYLEQGNIIIATNLAGRGTDIKISKQLRKAGGLHVCLTFLPNNLRVEQQAFGRAARCGDEGSGQLIMLNPYDSEIKQIQELKMIRDEEELNRLSEIKNYYETQIVTEECYFDFFMSNYKHIKNSSDLENKKLKEIALEAALDKWAFWLDSNSTSIKIFNDKKTERKFDDSFRPFISKLTNNSDLKTYVTGLLPQMIKLGKYYLQEGIYNLAIEVFNDVIKREPNFSEAAHYYKAYALAKQNDIKAFKKELKKTARLLKEHCQMHMIHSAMMNKTKKAQTEGIIQINSYEKQQQNIIDTYNVFLNNINNILGNVITPEVFICGDINEKLATYIYNKLKGVILKGPRISKTITNLESVSTNCFIRLEKLYAFIRKNAGKEIDFVKLEKTLKNEVKLISREGFWKEMIKQKVFEIEFKYVIINNDDLKTCNELLFNKVIKNISKKTLIPQDLNNLQKNKIILNALYGNNVVFEKNNFIEIIGKENFKILKENGILSINKVAVVKNDTLENTKLDHFDSINLEDFFILNITKIEAEKILKELVEKNILEISYEREYKLKINFDQIDDIELTFCKIYENDVKVLLKFCFAYRISLQYMQKQLEKEIYPISFYLKYNNPYDNLIFELLNQNIIKQSKIFYNNELDIKIKSIFKNKLSKNQIKFVTENINKLRSPLKAHKTCSFSLINIDEICKIEKSFNIEEIYRFSINAFDEIIIIEEEKWSSIMIFSSLTVTWIGLLQLVLGAIVQIHFGSASTHISSSIFNEGFNDIFYGIVALYSGYFSWKHYAQAKLKSTMFNIITAGVKVLSTTNSNFGTTLINATQIINTSNVSKENEIAKVILKSFFKKITLHFGKIGCEQLIQNYLFSFSNEKIDEILLHVYRCIDEHKIINTVNTAYQAFGEKEASNIFDLFQITDYIDFITPTIKTINSDIRTGINKGIKTLSIKILINYTVGLNKIVNNLNIDINKITTITKNFLNALDENMQSAIEEKCNNKKKATVELVRKEFKIDIIKKWKCIIKEHVIKILQEEIVNPMLTKDTNNIIMKIRRKQQEMFQLTNYKSNEKDIDKISEEYNKNINSLKDEYDEILEIDEHINKIYNENLQKLFEKTKNLNLLANILEKGIPIDLTCIFSYIIALPKIFEEQAIDISKYTIIIESKNGINQKFHFKPEEREEKIIKIILKDDYFQIFNSDQMKTIEKNYLENDLLYESLLQAIPELEEIFDFGKSVANVIRNNKMVQDRIQESWHQLSSNVDKPTNKLKIKIIRDDESIRNAICSNGIKISENIISHYIDFLQIAENYSSINNKTIQNYDLNCKMGKKDDTKEVIRIGNVNLRIKFEKCKRRSVVSEDYVEIKTIFEHIDFASKTAGEWHGIYKKENLKLPQKAISCHDLRKLKYEDFEMSE